MDTRTSTTRADLVAALTAIEPLAAADPGGGRVIRAPGRVNLIGEHTDYNNGLVLPAAIDLELRIALVPTDDGVVELALADGGNRERFRLDDVPPRQGRWLDYVTATSRAMTDAGLPRVGFRGLLSSELPPSAGLSSSAALELASMWALSGGSSPPIEPIDAARTAQHAENDYVGVRCGLMDQFAVACGRRGMALLLDCDTLDWEPVPLPPGITIVVAHTGSPRRLETSEYNARRADCERAVAAIAADDPAIRSLRDVDPSLLAEHRDRMDDIAWRRASHVIAENERVLATRGAFAAGDDVAIGELFAASHASLRDLFEVSSPELDLLVQIAVETPGVVAARMTGAGFGGCTVNLVHDDAVPDVRRRFEERYRPPSGHQVRVWDVSPTDGVGLLD